MRFCREIFYIHLVDNTLRKITDGWVDSDKIYGFYPLRKPNGIIFKWIATDLNSGLKICAAATRKGCAEWIEDNQDLINLQKTKPEYHKHMMWYRETRDNKN